MAKVLRKIKAWMNMDGYEDYEFPKSLEEFGYKFDEDGVLKTVEKNEPFIFRIKDNHHYNQKRYEALGEVVTDYIYDLMEKDMLLDRIVVPVDAEPEEPCSFIFVSKDALTSSKLMVLIHGSGAVRAGQWTRKLIINNNINIGSQLPYIRQGMKEGYGIIVLNTNLNTATEKSGYERLIRGNESPERHGNYVFKNFVMKAKASCIAVVAHSYGGIVTQELVNSFPEFFMERVFALAFTDSVHSFRQLRHANHVETRNFFKERGCNFAASYAPKNYPQNEGIDECPAVSAGTDKHEWTSHSSFDILFDFLSERLNDWVKDKHLENIQVDHETLYKPEDGEEAVGGSTDEGDEVEHSEPAKKETDRHNSHPPGVATTGSIEQKNEERTGRISPKQDLEGEKVQVYGERHFKNEESSNLPLGTKNVETKDGKIEGKENVEMSSWKGEGEKTEKVLVVVGEKSKDEPVMYVEETNGESVGNGKKMKEETMVESEKTVGKSMVVNKNRKDEYVVDSDERTKEESLVENKGSKEESVIEFEQTNEESVAEEKTKVSVIEDEKTKEETVVEDRMTKKGSLEDGKKTKETIEKPEKKQLDVVKPKNEENPKSDADAGRKSQPRQFTHTAGEKDEL